MGCLSWVLPNPLTQPATHSTHKHLRHQQNNTNPVPVAVNGRNPVLSPPCLDAPNWFSQSPSPSSQKNLTLHKSFVCATLAVLLSSPSANAGLLSGSSGIESIPGPELPQIDFLNRWNEGNQKKYADLDAKFQESPLLKQFIEKSKLNKEKNRQAIQDKYCLRGAEWGVGDCSTQGMSPEDRENFISALKQKVGVVD
ncbi:unnamed protein product [Cuscuta epithymum]|uniref:Uncharacterized protein n=1 Tax=Cuscuta epithymum TaxID=186058 RepID=A0AAV0EL72_9ASTE|nr:unnamed protein product [Cuscuta epithymum]